VAKCRRPLPAEGQRILQVMTRALRDRLHAFGWTHSALAKRLGRDRSRISHALTASGEELPPRQLIQSIAWALDAHAAEQGLSLGPLTVPTMRRWYEADQARSSAEKREQQERRRATAKRIEGAPPASLETHQDLLHALNALVTARFGSQRAMCRAWPLGRPAVSAALSDRRSLSIDLMDKILQACGVRGTDRQAWQDAWRRLAGPRQQAALERQRAGLRPRQA
jgi:ParB-like chromosome segregation protein Spo0J